MDVRGFLCVSLGSRRACEYSEAGFSSQNGDPAWGLYYRRAAFSCAFLWANGFNAEDTHKEPFSVYGGKYLSRKAIHNWVANVSLMTNNLKRRWGSGWEQQSKDFYAAGFDALASVLVEDMSRNKLFFQGSNITCFRFISICGLVTDSLL
jgi:hypothetical protein